MMNPKTLLGMILLTIGMTAVFMAAVAGMGALVASHWMFTGHHAVIWLCATGAFNGLTATVLALRKMKADKLALAPRMKVAVTPSRSLAGPGGVYRPRKA